MMRRIAVFATVCVFAMSSSCFARTDAENFGTYSYCILDAVEISMNQEWYENVVPVKTGNMVSFCEKDNYEKWSELGVGLGGCLFSVTRSDEEGFRNAEGASLIGLSKADDTYYYIETPVISSAYEYDAKLRKKYNDMESHVADAISGIHMREDIPHADSDTVLVGSECSSFSFRRGWRFLEKDGENEVLLRSPDGLSEPFIRIRRMRTCVDLDEYIDEQRKILLHNNAGRIKNGPETVSLLASYRPERRLTGFRAVLPNANGTADVEKIVLCEKISSGLMIYEASHVCGNNGTEYMDLIRTVGTLRLKGGSFGERKG